MKGAKTSRPHIAIREYILFGLAILLAIAAVGLSLIRPLDPEPRFTQFWILPVKNNSCAVLIGIHNFESTSLKYHAVMRINGTQVAEWSSIVLAPQQEWDKQVLLTLANNMYVDVQLYRANEPGTVYRDVHLTLHSLKEGGNGQKQQCTT